MSRRHSLGTFCVEVERCRESRSRERRMREVERFAGCYKAREGNAGRVKSKCENWVALTGC